MGGGGGGGARKSDDLEGQGVKRDNQEGDADGEENTMKVLSISGVEHTRTVW